MITKNRSYPVNRLIRFAFLEGAITTRGLYEKAVLRRGEAEMKENRSQAMTLRKLFREFDDAGPLYARTAGEFLREMRSQQGFTAAAVHGLLDIPLLTYKMLENDSVSPMNVSLSAWKKIRNLWKIPWTQLEDLIRASHYLMVFRPSYKGTLLRYRKKTSSTYPPDARVSAARELYLRARLPLPRHEQQSIERYMRELRGLEFEQWK
ncbi:MAG: hypothetical protein WEB33_02940 [Bacteroidota bacterium]